MVRVSAEDVCRTPNEPWGKWTAAARSLAAWCKENTTKWRQAEENDRALTLWAASFAKCAKGKGHWVKVSAPQRRTWLDELQGKPPRRAN